MNISVKYMTSKKNIWPNIPMLIDFAVNNFTNFAFI